MNQPSPRSRTSSSTRRSDMGQGGAGLLHFDGAGLPFGWQGAEIPMAARIVRLTRDFDLASQGWWPGHPAAVSARACMELVALAGQTVDPALVHAWLRVLDREVAADVA